MKIALVQIASPDDESPQARIERVRQQLLELPEVALIVLPELWGVGYFHFNGYATSAETLMGSTVSMCAEVARSHQCYVHIGSIVARHDNGQLYNAAILLNPAGEIVHQYHKIHIFGYESLEAKLLTPGNSITVTPTPMGILSGITCYDLRFTGLWQALSEIGTMLVIIPAAWPLARIEHWRLLTAARAVEYQLLIIACNAVGEQQGVMLGGHSRVVDPSGILLGESGTDETVLIVDINPDRIMEVRREFPVLKDRLSDYQSLIKRSPND